MDYVSSVAEYYDVDMDYYLSNITDNYSWGTDQPNWTDMATTRPSPPCDAPSAHRPLHRLLLAAFYCSLSLLGCASNGLVLSMLPRMDRRRRHRHGFGSPRGFLFHLALSDLIFSSSLVFWGAEEIWGWVLGRAACKLVGAAYNATLYSSVYLLVCISLERHLAVVRAVQSFRKTGPTKVHLVSLAVWGICLALMIPDLVYLHPVPSGGVWRCVHHYGDESSRPWVVGLRMFYHLAGFLLPASAMVYAYAMIGRTVLSSRGGRRKREWRAVRVSVAVVAAFLASWSPHNVVLSLETAHRLGAIGRDCDFERRLDAAEAATRCLGDLHCFLNPTIYAFLGARFRQEVASAFSGCGPGRPGSRAGVSRSSMASVNEQGENSTTWN